MLTDLFLHLTATYTQDKSPANNLWLEIFTKYSEPKRHYHTITHLEHMMGNLMKVKDKIEDWDTMLFVVFYHDIVYKATSSTNEEDSAKVAGQHLTEIGFPADKIAKCLQMILATKTHQESSDNDTRYLLDTDLAILGSSADKYLNYAEAIRQEYSLYPDFIYNPGRKKVIRHFLAMPHIYKTEYFHNAFETQARLNLQNELEELE